MKVIIVIVVVVLLLQLGTVAIGLKTEDGAKDAPTKNNVEEWNPKEKVPTASSFGDSFDWMRPKVKLHWESGSFGKDDKNVIVRFSWGHSEQRMVRFRLTRGTGVRILYNCKIHGKGFKCPQTLCLCQPGQEINVADYNSCDNFKQVLSSCPDKKNVGEIFVYGKMGQLLISGLGAHGGTIDQI